MLSGAAWRPAFFSTLVLDLDADMVTGADASAVSTWANQAPTGSTNNFVQATAGKQCTVRRNALNGRSALRSADTARIMTSAGFKLPVGAWTQFLVFQAASVPQNAFIINGQTTTPDVSYLWLRTTAGAYQAYNFVAKVAGAQNSVGVADAVDTSLHVVGITYNNGTNTDAASYTFNLDGTSKTVVASGFISRSSAEPSTVFNGSAEGNGFVGDIGRWLVFNGVLSTAQFAATLRYLRTRYGI